ncbi:MAG: FtsX-like permease family protein [Spirochaetes bacterium]|nr:FtsX-like permease family protein [Spirochaetota bacterium]
MSKGDILTGNPVPMLPLPLPVRLAFRNLLRRGNRFLFLLLLVAFSSLVILSLASLFDTLIFNLKRKASVYYGGDITVRGLKDRYTLIIEEPGPLMQALREVLPEGTVISPRINYRNTSTTLFFAGDSIRQRIVNGVDFREEAPMFDQVTFVEGSYKPLQDRTRKRPGILVSEPAAQLLKARVGDDLLLYIPTLSGQINTATVVLEGIFRDSSLFGYYTAYMEIETLRSLVRFPVGQCTDIAIFFPQSKPTEEGAVALQKALEPRFPMTPLFHRQQDLWNYRDRTEWSGTRYSLTTLDANLEKVNELLDAVRFIAYLLIGILGAIVFFGVTNSYRLTVFERRKEIGTLRALGMKKGTVMELFLAEGVFLTILSVLAGAGCAVLFLTVLSSIDFSFLAGFDIFLRGRRLQALPSLRALFLTFGVCMTAVMIALLKPTLMASSIPPIEAMREDHA